jgi:hypothetical protein
MGQGARSVEETIDPADAAAVAVTPLQFGAQFEACDGAAPGAQLVDDLLDLGVREVGRAGHPCSLADYGK